MITDSVKESDEVSSFAACIESGKLPDDFKEGLGQAAAKNIPEPKPYVWTLYGKTETNPGTIILFNRLYGHAATRENREIMVGFLSVFEQRAPSRALAKLMRAWHQNNQQLKGWEATSTRTLAASHKEAKKRVKRGQRPSPVPPLLMCCTRTALLTARCAWSLICYEGDDDGFPPGIVGIEIVAYDPEINKLMDDYKRMRGAMTERINNKKDGEDEQAKAAEEYTPATPHEMELVAKMQEEALLYYYQLGQQRV